MGRIFEKRKDRMFARWAKTSKAFTKIGREIAIAVRAAGPNPDTNPRLRMAMNNARTFNMPKDRVENAIKRASEKDSEGLAEVNYEAYGPHGVAIFVETTTNNPTRTVGNVRSIIVKHGGNLATTGALDFIFTRRGVFRIANAGLNLDELELEMIDHGLEEMFETEDGDLLAYTSFSSFGDMQHFLESRKVQVKSAGLERSANAPTEVSEEIHAEIMELVEALEEDDDVLSVYHNMA